MMLVIKTQYQENYGSPTDPYWKNKGGSEYKVTNVSLSKDLGSDIVDSVKPLIVKNTDYQIEFIVDWSWENDDYLSWFEQSQLDFDGEIMYNEPIIDFNDIPTLLQIAEMEKVQALQEIE